MALILIADDSPAESFVLKQLLEQHGHQVTLAEDGEQAIAMVLSKRPDLILMDVVMPKLNGFQATRRLQKDSATSDIPIIIISAKNQETDRVWGMRQGAKGYLGKPVDNQALLSQINTLLTGK